MKRLGAGGLILVAMAVLMGMPGSACAQGAFEQISGKAFDSAIPMIFTWRGIESPCKSATPHC